MSPEERKRRAILDLIMSAKGHLRGEDWDKEMLEALIELEQSKK